MFEKPSPAPPRTRTHRGKEYAVSAAHPAADAFPWLGEDELQALADDIAAHGQRDPIERVAGSGLVIDGRNREFACFVAGVTPDYLECNYTEAQIVALVVSRNIQRRNLTPSQRAMIAAELANWKLGQNQHTEGAPRGAPSDESQGNQVTEATTQNEAAEALDVSRRHVQRATKVKEDAPELAPAVRDGKLDLKTAEKVADLPPKKRRAVASAPDPKAEAKKALAPKPKRERATAPADSEPDTFPLDAGPASQPEPPGYAPGPRSGQPDEVPPRDERPRDALGRIVPEKLLAVWAAKKLVTTAAEDLLPVAVAGVKRVSKTKALGGTDGPLGRAGHHLRALQECERYLRDRVEPFVLCPMCDAGQSYPQDCPTCGGRMWVSRAGYSLMHPVGRERCIYRAKEDGGSGLLDPVDAEVIAELETAAWTPGDWAGGPGRDGAGMPIPPKLRDTFACDEILFLLAHLKALVHLLDGAKGWLYWLKPEAHEVGAQYVRLVTDALPFAVCMHCEGKGKGCAHCNTSGYFPRHLHENGHNKAVDGAPRPNDAKPQPKSKPKKGGA